MPPPASSKSPDPTPSSTRPRWLRWLLRLLAWSVGLAVAPQLMDVPIGRALLSFSN